MPEHDQKTSGKIQGLTLVPILGIMVISAKFCVKRKRFEVTAKSRRKQVRILREPVAVFGEYRSRYDENQQAATPPLNREGMNDVTIHKPED